MQAIHCGSLLNDNNNNNNKQEEHLSLRKPIVLRLFNYAEVVHQVQ